MSNKDDWKAAGAASDGKADNGKLRMSLLMVQFGEILRETAGVLTFGADKYPKPPLDDSWRDVPNGVMRYQDALYRHLDELFVKGDRLDSESGRHHLAHAMCNIVFLYELLEEQEKSECQEKQISPINTRETYDITGTPYVTASTLKASESSKS